MVDCLSSHQKQRIFKWEAHTCLPLHRNASLEPLLRYHQAQVSYVSINVGMDLNPLNQIIETIAHFRQQLNSRSEFALVNRLEEIRENTARGILSVGFDLEGAVPLLNNPEMIFLYKDLGVHQMHLAYNRNNMVAGGCHDPKPQGLSDLGRDIVQAMNNAGVIVDCSHMSKQTVLDVLKHSNTSPIFSHANPSYLTPHQRNVDDHVLEALKERQGVLCLNGVNLFLGQDIPTVPRFLDHLCYVVDKIGVESVGVGLDIGFEQPELDDSLDLQFDPEYWWPSMAGYHRGISQIEYLPPETWSILPQKLVNRGFNEEEVKLILGENMARIFRQVEDHAKLQH